jgi:hypothetical protein
MTSLNLLIKLSKFGANFVSKRKAIGYVTGPERRVSYRICNIFTCVTLIRLLGVERIDSCAVVGCDAMDAYIFVCAVSDSWISTKLAQEKEKRESEWGDIENVK